jgi:peptidoglycan DL-endopeptidase CwlO
VKRRNSGSTKIVVATTLTVVALVGISVFSVKSFAANNKESNQKQLVILETGDEGNAVNSKSLDARDLSGEDSLNESKIVSTENVSDVQYASENIKLAAELEVVDSKVVDKTIEQSQDELIVVDNTVEEQKATTQYTEENIVCEEEPVAYEEMRLATYEEETVVYEEDTTIYEEETAAYEEETATYEEETAAYEEETATYEEETAVYEEVTTTYEKETTAYEEDTTTYEEETTAYEEDTTTYEEETTAYEEETIAYEEEITEEQAYDDVSYNAELASQIVNYAYQWVGVTPYVDAADRYDEELGYYVNSLTEGTDCSGFTNLIYGTFGIYVPTWSDAYQYGYVGTMISYDQLMPGDIVVYDYGGHVAIYAGDDTIIHCSNPADGTKISTMWYKTPTAYVRVVY